MDSFTVWYEFRPYHFTGGGIILILLLFLAGLLWMLLYRKGGVVVQVILWLMFVPVAYVANDTVFRKHFEAMDRMSSGELQVAEGRVRDVREICDNGRQAFSVANVRFANVGCNVMAGYAPGGWGTPPLREGACVRIHYFESSINTSLTEKVILRLSVNRDAGHCP